MQRLFLFTVIFIANMMAMNAATKQIITRIDPTDWYVGLKNPTVQLMVAPRLSELSAGVSESEGCEARHDETDISGEE